MAVPATESIDPSRPLLFSPFRIRGLTLKNRLVVPPMVHYRAGPGSTCGMFHNVHLGRYALGGFGLVFVEATAVEEIGLINEHRPRHLERGAGRELQAAHRLHEGREHRDRHSARAWRAQIVLAACDGRHGSAHPARDRGGRKAVAARRPDRRAGRAGMAGAAPAHDRRVPGDGSHLGRAARNAVKAGFDAIEVHTAHGYLLASFLSPISNTRNDEYGGDRTGRMRLPLEIVEAVRREMPETMPLFVRVSAVDGTRDGWNLDDTVAFAAELKRRGVDVIDCSSGGISGSATAAQVPRGLGFQVPYAERVRNEAGIPTMAVGIILEAQQAEEILGNGQADLIAVGRQSQFNPNIAQHWAHDLGINEKFEDWTAEFGWWLEKRTRTIEGFATPTGIVKRQT